MAAKRPARPQRGLVPGIVETLKTQIQTGRIAVGARLPTEGELMAQFGVSRTVVREAISQLQASGLTQTRHGIGTFVVEALPQGNFHLSGVDLATLEDVISVLELRIGLETEAAALAARRRTPQHVAALENCLRLLADASAQGVDAVTSDFDFHAEVARASGNRHFNELMRYLGRMIIPRTRINTADQAPEGRQAYLQRVHAEHEAICNAIRNQDAEAARAAMRIHLTNSRDRLRAAAH